MIDQLKPLFGKLTNFAQNKMGFKYPPKLFLKADLENSKSCLGRTAHYDPAEMAITIFTTGRHPKDILRSFSHELVHHTQNLRGDLSPEKCGTMGDKYAQENPHMRKMEEEAYLVGNMCFRDWEDNEKFNLQESKILKENKVMTNKVTKESLKEMIQNILERKIKEGVPLEDEELGAGGAGMAGDEEETMDTGDHESFGKLSPEEAESGWGDGPQSPVSLQGLDAQELVQVMRSALNLLDKDTPLQGRGEAVAAHQDEELEEIRVGGNAAKSCDVCKKEGCEGCAVEEATTHQDVVDAADDAVDATNSAAAKEKSKKAVAKKAAKDPGAKYDDDLFDAPADEDDEIAGIKEIDLNGTPEREKNLYEARFNNRNTNLFEGLIKKWAK